MKRFTSLLLVGILALASIAYAGPPLSSKSAPVVSPPASVDSGPVALAESKARKAMEAYAVDSEANLPALAKGSPTSTQLAAGAGALGLIYGASRISGESSTSAVPEPASLLVLSGGAAVLLRRKRR